MTAQVSVFLWTAAPHCAPYAPSNCKTGSASVPVREPEEHFLDMGRRLQRPNQHGLTAERRVDISVRVVHACHLCIGGNITLFAGLCKRETVARVTRSEEDGGDADFGVDLVQEGGALEQKVVVRVRNHVCRSVTRQLGSSLTLSKQDVQIEPLPGVS